MASTQVRPGQVGPIPLDAASGEVSGILPVANGGTGSSDLTLTSPTISTIKESTGATVLSLVAGGATPVNYIELANADAGGTLAIRAQGASSNIDFAFTPKGTGRQMLYAVNNTTTGTYAFANGGNCDYTIDAQGTGMVKVGGMQVDRWFCRQDASRTLTSTTSVQKLFNASTNGAVTLPTGVYRFNCLYSLSSMSATTGNSAFSLAGTAVTGTILMMTSGADIASATVSALSGAMAVTSAFPNPQHTTGTTAGQQSWVSGTFEVTTTGTVIPSVALGTAAAAVLAAGSFFECWLVSTSTTAATFGNWS